MEKIATISVTGPDALAFLQGQLTNELRRLDTEREIPAAWCNPKGRVIWFGTVRATGSGYSLSAPAELAEEIVRRLAVFRFRAKVDIAVTGTESEVDPAVLIRAGHPFIGRAQSEQFTPHMLNLDLIGAISFEKGCYTGQEIVARTHYKGATKRRTLRFSSALPVEPGARVSDGSRDVGEVLNVAGTDLLAVVPLDGADATLTVNDVPLSRQALPYLE